MKVHELIEHLKTLPQDIDVYYTDAAFGSPYQLVTNSDLEVQTSNDSNNYGTKYLAIGSVGCDCHLE